VPTIESTTWWLTPVAVSTAMMFQRRLGHRKPDTTLRVYAHQWKYREARRSQIGQQLGQLFDTRKALPSPGASETRLALPPASTGDQQ